MANATQLLEQIKQLSFQELLLFWDGFQAHLRERFTRSAVSTEPAVRPYALAAGEFEVEDAFFEPLPDEWLDVFEGKLDE